MRLRICSYRWLEEQLSAPRLTVSMMSWTPSTCHPPAKWVAKWLDWSNRSKRSTNLQVTQIHSGPNRWKFPEVPMSKDCVYMPKQTPTFRPCLTPTIYLLLVPPECATVLCEQLLTWVVLRMANVCPEWMLHDYSIIFTHAHGRCAAGEQKQETIINHLLPWFSVQLSLQKKKMSSNSKQATSRSTFARRSFKSVFSGDVIWPLHNRCFWYLLIGCWWQSV